MLEFGLQHHLSIRLGSGSFGILAEGFVYGPGQRGFDSALIANPGLAAMLGRSKLQ